MAAAQGRLSDGTGNANGTPPDGTGGTEGTGGTDATDQSAQDADQTPAAFRTAVGGLLSAQLRPCVALEPVRPPRRLAPYAYALQAAVTDDGDGEDLADGRLVLLHDPDGHESWHGAFRLVTLVRAELEPEMAADPLLPEVCWSWLTGALQARGLSCGEPSGTVTHASSHHFGGLAQRPPASQIEIRASWTPGVDQGGVPDTSAHLAAWCDLLCQVAGLPPAVPADPSVVTLPQRRGPRPA
jgi:DUF3000 family protein